MVVVMSRVTDRRGFTFVELIIAATMISVLFVGLSSHLRGGIVVWRRATQSVELIQRRHIAVDRLTQDLANAFVYYNTQASAAQNSQSPAVEFGRDRLAWLTVVPTTAPQRSAIRFVTYACERIEGALWLRRTSQSVGEARRGDPLPTPELLLPGCKAMSIRYAYAPPPEIAGTAETLEWHDEWRMADKEPDLPRLVEISFRISGAAVGLDTHGEQEITRVFAIPSGVLKTFPETPPPS